MSNFIIIDHSLKEAGGHHYDYARCISQTAAAAGFRPVLATHRSFPASAGDGLKSIQATSPMGVPSPEWRAGSCEGSDISIQPVFRQTTYQPDSYLAGLQQMTRSHAGSVLLAPDRSHPWARWYHWMQNRPHRRRRERFVRTFAADCRRLFSRIQPQPGDHVLLSTISELELMGLASYLSAHPASVDVHWHLQFHFNLFDGRTPEYASQTHVANAVSACFLASLARLTSHSVHFYTTSMTLADQYNSLGVGHFRSLPYPVAKEFQSLLGLPSDAASQPMASSLSATSGALASTVVTPTRAAKAGLSPFGDATANPFDRSVAEGRCPSHPVPIRVGCLGGIRREKQQAGYLQEVVDQLWEDQLGPGKLQLVVQRPAGRFRASSRKLELQIPEVAHSGAAVEPIEYAEHPLPYEAYLKLIDSIDVGLLYYDSRAYYGRRAGILGEYLAAGKPVIVSAGSWLADQLEIPNRDYVRHLLQSFQGRRLQDSDLEWNSCNVPLPGGVLSFDHLAHPFVFAIDRQPAESSVGIEFDWHWPKTAGIYCRIELTQLDSSGAALQTSRRVIGCSRDMKTCNALFALDPQATRLQFSLTNAYDDSTANVRNLMVTTGVQSDALTGPVPIGSIGVIAADQADLVNCIDEVVRHFDHYRANAQVFAGQWYSRHDPQRTLSQLLSVATAVSDAA